MKPRFGGEFVYFLVVAMTLLLRISQYLGVDATLGVDLGVHFTLVVQLCCFGLLPVLGWWIIVGGCRKDELCTLTRTFGIVKCPKRDFLRVLIITVPLLLITGVIANGWYAILTFTGFESGSSAGEEQTVQALVTDIILSAVLPGVFEELTHRGELLATFRTNGGKAVVMSALLFALVHQNVVQFAHTLFLGFVLAYIVYCTRSLLPAVFLHFFNNFISVVSGYDELAPAFGVISGARSWLYGSVAGMFTLILLAALSVVLIAVVLRRMRWDAVREGRLRYAPFFAAERGTAALSKDILLWCILAVGVAATLFTLVWGYI